MNTEHVSVPRKELLGIAVELEENALSQTGAASRQSLTSAHKLRHILSRATPNTQAVTDEDVERAINAWNALPGHCAQLHADIDGEDMRAALESFAQSRGAVGDGMSGGDEYHCNICGGSVRLKDATTPTVGNVFVGAPSHVERARPTERRIEAVELLLKMGFKWSDGKWNPASHESSSCMSCGYINEPGVYHSLLPSSYVCKACVSKVLSAAPRHQEKGNE